MVKKSLVIVALVSTCLQACSLRGSLQPNSNIEEGGHQAEVVDWMKSPSILVFSKTLEWRHDGGISGADLFFVKLAENKGYDLLTTVNSAVFNEADLERFDVVVFNNVTGDVLSKNQRVAFQKWFEKKGRWIGLHSVGDKSIAKWDWFQTNFIGTGFIGHTMQPQFQEAEVVVLKPDHPVVQGLPPSFNLTDEWYSFDQVPPSDEFIPLLGLDEATYAPTNKVVERWPEDLRMGNKAIDHPIAWSFCRGDAKGVYSAIGHSYENYEEPEYQKFLVNAFDWVASPSVEAECN